MSDDTAATAVLSVITAVAGLSAGWLSYKISQLSGPVSPVKSDEISHDQLHQSNQTSPLLPEEEQKMVEQKVDLMEFNFNDIEIQQKLSEDNYSILYKAIFHGSTVSYRVIKQTMTRKALEDELAHLLQSRHPSLVLLMGATFDPAAKRWGLVTPFMGKGSLRDVLSAPEAQTPLPWRQRAHMMQDMARGLLYLHKSGVVHGNFTSRSVLLDDEFRAKLTEFGVGKIRPDSFTAIGGDLPLWSSPEVMMGVSKGDPASDVYSFGMVMWEILTRQAPFAAQLQTASSSIQVLRQITNANLRPPIPPGCPPQIASLIEACWQSSPQRRPTMEQVVEQVATFSKIQLDIAKLGLIEIKIDNPRSRSSSLSSASASAAAARKLDVQWAQQQPWHISFDELTLGEMIGAGSFGQVFKATFRGKTVAVKKMSPELVKNEQAMGEFINELTLMSSMKHPNTVLFMGACLQAPNVCIVMEYCAKGSLYSVLHDKGAHLDYDRILKIIESIAQALSYLHGMQPAAMLHRDLKSLNVLVDENWNIKVSDFGLTKMMAESAGSNGSEKLGTPLWQAPEALEGANQTEASDVYSFAVIMWELWTRTHPFQGMSPIQAVMKVLHDDARPEIPAFVPQVWVDLIVQCWHRKPSERPLFPSILDRLAVIRAQGLPKTNLGADNSKLWRKKMLVHAFSSRDPVTVFKSWGCGESKPGDWVIVGTGDDVYTCDAAIFQKTYVQEPGQPHVYRKTGTIWARKMQQAFLVVTLEGMEHGEAGDYLAQNSVDGEQWPIDTKTFEKTYEEVAYHKSSRGSVIIDDEKKSSDI